MLQWFPGSIVVTGEQGDRFSRSCFAPFDVLPHGGEDRISCRGPLRMGHHRHDRTGCIADRGSVAQRSVGVYREVGVFAALFVGIGEEDHIPFEHLVAEIVGEEESPFSMCCRDPQARPLLHGRREGTPRGAPSKQMVIHAL